MLNWLSFECSSPGSIFITHLGWKETGCTDVYNMQGLQNFNIHAQPLQNFFPDIASWDVPIDGTCRGMCRIDSKLRITLRHPACSDLKPGQSFVTTSPSHMIMKAGSKGKVIVRDNYDDPVCVVGRYGKGKVAYSGCFYGSWTPKCKSLFGDNYERQLFFGIFEWLAEKDNSP